MRFYFLNKKGIIDGRARSLRILDVTEALYQFDCSEDTIKKTHRYILFVFLPVLIICMFGFGLFITGFKIKETLLCFCSPILIAIIIGAIEIPFIDRRHRKIKAFIHNDKIVKQCGKHETSMPWDNIARIKINENNKGEIVHIKLRGKDKKMLWFCGLNEMGKLAGLIRERISNDILVNTKRNRLDLRIIGIISAISMTIFMTIIASLGDKAMDIFAIVFALSASCYLSLFRPLSKIDVSIKWLEIVFSLLFFILGTYGLISFLRSLCLS